MRSEKELLQVLLDNMDEHELGLCFLCHTVYAHKFITLKECYKLLDYIKDHAPDRFINGIKQPYNWGVGEKQPRIDWLNEQINKL